MATSPVISMLAARAGLDAITAKVTTGSTVNIYTGSQPANTLASETGTLLSSNAMSSTPVAASTDGGSNGLATAAANTITNATAGNTGTAGHFRVVTSGGVAIFMGSCGTSAADCVLNTTTITSGDTVAITSWTITLPDGTGTD